jgi:hypothetical protein
MKARAKVVLKKTIYDFVAYSVTAITLFLD